MLVVVVDVVVVAVAAWVVVVVTSGVVVSALVVVDASPDGVEPEPSKNDSDSQLVTFPDRAGRVNSS